MITEKKKEQQRIWRLKNKKYIQKKNKEYRLKNKNLIKKCS
jgi:hypothetical protein